MDIYAWIYNIVNKEKENGKKKLCFLFVQIVLCYCFSNDLELDKVELKMKIRS
jgi:uncharacterized membrane protein YwzB